MERREAELLWNSDIRRTQTRETNTRQTHTLTSATDSGGATDIGGAINFWPMNEKTRRSICFANPISEGYKQQKAWNVSALNSDFLRGEQLINFSDGVYVGVHQTKSLLSLLKLIVPIERNVY